MQRINNVQIILMRNTIIRWLHQYVTTLTMIMILSSASLAPIEKKTKNGYLISKKDQNLRKGSYTGTFDTTMESPKLDNPLTSYFSPNFVDISAIEKA